MRLFKSDLESQPDISYDNKYFNSYYLLKFIICFSSKKIPHQLNDKGFYNFLFF